MHRNTVFYPAPASHGQRLAPAGKHSKGRAPKKVAGQIVGGADLPGAFGRITAKLEAKDVLLRQSSEDAKAIANQRSLRQAYAKWRTEMSPEELAVARKLKVHFPAGSDGGDNRKPKQGTVEIDFHDPADLPESSFERHPQEDIEPRSPFSVAVENLGCEEITAAADCFSAALTWALDVPEQRDLVLIGKRALAVIYMLYPDLVTGVERDVAKRVIPFFEDVPFLEDEHDALATGEIFGRVLEWVRRGTSISEIGERLCLVAYVVRPTMMGSPTLHQLGDVMNKTRQAKDKLVSCLRDTFAGIRAMAQRGEHTRDKCIAAH